MKENRWIYVVGIVVLVALVAAGLIWRGQGDSGEGDGGGGGDASAAADGGGGDGAVAAADGGAGGEGGVDDIGDVPTDPAECRAYCGRLAERRALKQGATAETCVASLCTAEASAAVAGGGDGGGAEPTEPQEAIPTMSDAGAAEPSSDCAVECRRLHAAGELRSGMTVDACIATLCSEGEEE